MCYNIICKGVFILKIKVGDIVRPFNDRIKYRIAVISSDKEQCLLVELATNHMYPYWIDIKKLRVESIGWE
nr:MAG TPA: PHD finger protein [Caudoviricetes sp.]